VLRDSIGKVRGDYAAARACVEAIPEEIDPGKHRFFKLQPRVQQGNPNLHAFS